MEQLEIDLIADETGVRETNRIIGEDIVTAEQYITGYHYSDSICYAFYPIDLHVMNGIEQTFHNPYYKKECWSLPLHPEKAPTGVNPYREAYLDEHYPGIRENEYQKPSADKENEDK